MADMIVRPMLPEDVAEALDAFATVAQEGVWLGTPPNFDRQQRLAAWSAGLIDPSLRSLVVVDSETGRILGNGSADVASYGVVDLGMALVKSARGQGVGGRLLDALLDASRDLGAHKAFLYVWPHNEAALRLYLSRGFEVEGRLRGHYRRPDGQLWDCIVIGRALGAGSAAAGGDPAGGEPGVTSRGCDLTDAPVLPRTIPITTT